LKYDFAIATTTYFAPYANCKDVEYRVELFYTMCESLAKVDWSGSSAIWVIHDDASPAFPVMMDVGIPVEVIRHKENLTIAGNSGRSIQHAAGLGEWVVVADSDGLFARDCFLRLKGLMQQYPDEGIFGLFNTKYHKLVEDRGDHVIKATLCEHGTVFHNSLAGFCFGRIRMDVGPYPCLKPSGLQHTGQVGLNSTTDDFDSEFQVEGVSFTATRT